MAKRANNSGKTRTNRGAGTAGARSPSAGGKTTRYVRRSASSQLVEETRTASELPVSHTPATDLIAASHIEQTAGTRGGRPRVAGTRITVDDIVIMHRHLGQSLELIAGKYDLKPAAVHAAMAYYYDHKAEIDGQIATDDAYVEAFMRDHPSRLKEKLKALGRG